MTHVPLSVTPLNLSELPRVESWSPDPETGCLSSAYIKLHDLPEFATRLAGRLTFAAHPVPGALTCRYTAGPTDRKTRLYNGPPDPSPQQGYNQQ